MFQQTTPVNEKRSQSIKRVRSLALYRQIGVNLKKIDLICEQDRADIERKQSNVVIISTSLHPMSIPNNLHVDAYKLKEQGFDVVLNKVDRRFWKNKITPEEIILSNASGAWDAP